MFHLSHVQNSFSSGNAGTGTCFHSHNSCLFQQLSALFLTPSIEGVRIGVVKCFPQTEKLDGITIAHPITNHSIGVNVILLSGNVRNTDIVNTIDIHRSDICILYSNYIFLCHFLFRSYYNCKITTIFQTDKENCNIFQR